MSPQTQARTFAFVTETGTAGVRVLTIGTNGGTDRSLRVSLRGRNRAYRSAGRLLGQLRLRHQSAPDNTISGYVLAANGT